MPLVKKVGQYEFRFYSRGEASEPPHIHVKRGRLEAKFWLTPLVQVARPGRYRLHELNQIARLVEANRQEFIEVWHEYFG
jgi:Domain of unknown function (DUF4160)